MKRAATISADGLYRYDLIRTVEPDCECPRCYEGSFPRKHPGYVLWVLANPSTANAVTDDATERRGWGFTNFWNYGEMRFVNVNPFRSTEPKHVRGPDESILNINDFYLASYAKAAALIICAWGSHADPYLAQRAHTILRRNAPNGILYALGFTKSGAPKHPLYLRSVLQPVIWNPQLDL